VSDEPVNEAPFFSTIRSWRIVRGDSRVFGGVLSGLGHRVGLAPTPARIIFVALAILTGGIAVIGYAALWALLPDSRGSIIIQDFGRGRPNVGALVAIAVVTVFGFIYLGDFGLLGNWDILTNGSMGPGGSLARLFVMGAAILVPIGIVAGVIGLIVWAVRSSSNNANRAAGGYARLPDGTVPTGPAPTVAAAAAAPADAAAAAAAPSPAPAPAYAAPPPPVPPVYSAPRQPWVPGPGKVGYLLALAWIPLTIAITIYLSASDRLAVFPLIAAGVIYTAGLGVIVMITALRGRKSGFLGFVSVVALIPLAVILGNADQIRSDYANGYRGDWWSPTVVVESHDAYPDDEYVSDPEPEPFDPASAFLDYSTVVVNGSCHSLDHEGGIDADATIRLAEVAQNQTITVSSSTTRLIIPDGTNLNIVPPSSGEDWDPSVDVIWADRDVTCYLNTGAPNGVTLADVDGPTLTVRVQDGGWDSMIVWIEEN